MSRTSRHPFVLARRTFLVGSASTVLAATAGANAGFGNALTATLDASQYGTDDVAIQQVVDEAQAGDTVLLPPGNYQIANAIVVAKPLTLAGPATARLVATAAADISALVVVMQTNNVTIQGLTFDGNSNPHALQGILVATSQYVRIEGVTIQDLVDGAGFGPHGIYFSSLVTDSVITNNTFHTIGTGATYGGGVRVANGSARVEVTDNTITNTGRGGIFTSSTTAVLEGMVVSRNVISGSGLTVQGLGIEVNDAVGSLIEDNTVDSWISLSPSSLTAVRRNVVQGLQPTPRFAGIELIKSSDLVVTNNQVLGGQRIGLCMSNAQLKERMFVAHNQFLNSASVGIVLQGNTGGLEKVYLFDNEVAGTSSDFDLTWFGYEGTGISFHGNQRVITLEANSIEDNELDALRFLKSGDLDYFAGGIDQLEIFSNSFADNGGEAVGGLPLSAADLIWDNNHVAGNIGGDNVPSSVGFQNAPHPGLSISVPQTAYVGDPVTPVLSGPDLAGTEYLWDFDSGVPQTGRDSAFTYTAAGTYDVSVVAWTAAGRAQRLSASIAIGD